MSDKLPTTNFLKLHLTTPAIAIGERVKKGTFRPCIETLPTSTVMGCFREHFGLKDIVAIGFFDRGTYRKEIFTYAPFDGGMGTAKLPLTLEYIAPQEGYENVEGELYVVANEQTRRLFAGNEKSWIVAMGALKSKGFGHCTLHFKKEVAALRKAGYLRGSLRLTDAPEFGIDPEKDIIRPCYGYLFRPDEFRIGGRYELALFPGSIIGGPDFLMERGYDYDR